MLSLSNLIKKVDYFYHNSVRPSLFQKYAQDFSKGFSMPDDEEEAPETERTETDLSSTLYEKLTELARIIRDPNISSEALLIGDMYRKAIELNDGFNAIRKAIGNFINILDIDDPDNEEDPLNQMVDLMNEINKDSITRAKTIGGGLNKGDSQQAVDAIREVQNQFNQQSREEELEGQNRSVSDLSDIDPEAAAKFDLSGGISREEAQTKGRGYSVGYRKDLKDWIASYENEKERYSEELSSDENPKTIENKKKLIQILDQLKELTAEEADFFKELQVTNRIQIERDPITKVKKTTFTNSEDEKKLNLIRDKIKDLKKTRQNLKVSLREKILDRQSSQLEEKYNTAKDPKEKFKLEQEILLIKALQSKDKNKGEEIKLRKMLLSFLPHISMTETGLQTLKNWMTRIDEATKKRIPFAQFEIEKAKEIGERMGKVPIKTEHKGKYVIKNIPGVRDWQSIKLSGYIENLSKALLAERKTAKDRLIGSKNKKVPEEIKSNFKPYLDEISKASDNVAKASNPKEKSLYRAVLLKAVQALRQKIHEAVRLTPEFTQYVISVKSSRYFHMFKNRLSQINSLGIEDKEKLTESEISFIKETIETGRKIIDYYRNVELKLIKPIGEQTIYKNPYDTPTNVIEMSCLYLNNILAAKGAVQLTQKIDEETGEVYYE